MARGVLEGSSHLSLEAGDNHRCREVPGADQARGTAGLLHPSCSDAGVGERVRLHAVGLSNGVYGGTATWKATDNVKVAGYEVNLKWVSNGTSYIAGGTWMATGTSMPVQARARTTERYSAKPLRIQYRTGPRYGRAKAYVGGVYFGTINAYAKRYGTRWITLTGVREAHERIRFVPLTSKDVYIGKVHVIPDVTKAVTPGPARN